MKTFKYHLQVFDGPHTEEICFDTLKELKAKQAEIEAAEEAKPEPEEEKKTVLPKEVKSEKKEEEVW